MKRTGKWGIRVNRVELKAIDPPKSIIDAMEKQLRAERDKRAAILTAEGVRQSQILTAEGAKQSAILTAEGAKRSAILTAEGERQARQRCSSRTGTAGPWTARAYLGRPDPERPAYPAPAGATRSPVGDGTPGLTPSEPTRALDAISVRARRPPDRHSRAEHGTPEPAMAAGPPDRQPRSGRARAGHAATDVTRPLVVPGAERRPACESDLAGALRTYRGGRGSRRAMTGLTAAGRSA